MSSNFNLIPVTRKSTTRAHADASYGFSATHGDLSIVLSPALFARNPRPCRGQQGAGGL